MLPSRHSPSKNVQVFDQPFPTVTLFLPWLSPGPCTSLERRRGASQMVLVTCSRDKRAKQQLPVRPVPNDPISGLVCRISDTASRAENRSRFPDTAWVHIASRPDR